MHEPETSGAPATNGSELIVPMSEPCSLCLPMHSLCNQTTCPSLLLFRQKQVKKVDQPFEEEYWIISTSLFALEESASRGCFVCATLYTGLMTHRDCRRYKKELHLRVARNGHVGVRKGVRDRWIEGFSFYIPTSAGKKLMCPLPHCVSPAGMIIINTTADASRECVAFPALTASQSTSTGSDLSLENIKQWIQKCKTHRHCPNVGDSVLPTRILDIGDFAVKSPHNPLKCSCVPI